MSFCYKYVKETISVLILLRFKIEFLALNQNHRNVSFQNSLKKQKIH